MKKINFWIIVRDHLSSLSDARDGKVMFSDFIVFFVLPIALAFGSLWSEVAVPEDVEASLIAVYSVFAALLFSAQIGLFGLFSRNTTMTGDTIFDAKTQALAETNRKFFRDVNANISYLILLSCFSLLFLLLALFVDFAESIEDAVLIFLVSHFLLTLVMVIKRIHVAFASRYADPS